MILIYYVHSKYTHDLKVVKFETFKNKKSIVCKFEISRVFYHMSKGCNVHEI